MKYFKTTVVTLMVASAVAVSVVSGNAQTLNLTGGTIEGSLLNQELVGAYPTNDIDVNNGSISTWVVNDPSLDDSGNIFIYQAVNGGIDAIDQVELTGFTSGDLGNVISTATYSALGGSLLLPGSQTPSSGGNFPSEDTFAGTATFQNGDLLNGNTPSYFLVVETDVYYFGQSYGEIQDDFTAQGNILAPVPEPSSSILLLAGFACLYGIFKYRRVARLS